MVRKIIAGFLIALFVPLWIVTILGFTIKSTLLNPSFYQEQINQEIVYTKIINHALPLVVGEIIPETENQLIEPEQITALVQSTVTADWLASQVNTLTNSISTYINGQSDSLQGEISLVEVKTNLSTAITNIIKNSQEWSEYPTCTLENLPDWDIISTDEEFEFDCLPAGFDPEIIAQNFVDPTNENSIINTIPDTISLSNLQPSETSRFNPLVILKGLSEFYTNTLYILLFLNILLLAIIGLVIYKPIKSVAKWVATALTIPAGLTLLFSLLGILSVSIITKNIFLPPEIGFQLISLGIDIFKQIILAFYQYLTIYSIITLVIAIILFIIARYYLTAAKSTKDRPKLRHKKTKSSK